MPLTIYLAFALNESSLVAAQALCAAVQRKLNGILL
jgi:hypothetical protein